MVHTVCVICYVTVLVPPNNGYGIHNDAYWVLLLTLMIMLVYTRTYMYMALLLTLASYFTSSEPNADADVSDHVRLGGAEPAPLLPPHDGRFPTLAEPAHARFLLCCGCAPPPSPVLPRPPRWTIQSSCTGCSSRSRARSRRQSVCCRRYTPSYATVPNPIRSEDHRCSQPTPWG